MRHVAKTLKETLEMKFPDAKPDEILKVSHGFWQIFKDLAGKDSQWRAENEMKEKPRNFGKPHEKFYIRENLPSQN